LLGSEIDWIGAEQKWEENDADSGMKQKKFWIHSGIPSGFIYLFTLSV
jgi:hypothetical protein